MAVENLWDDATYDVVRLDFSELTVFPTPEDFENRFDDHLIRRFSEAGFSYEAEKGDVREELAEWLDDQPPGSLVLLIDGYDAPLIETLGEPELRERVRLVMSDFFFKVKANDRGLHLVFMTGITRVAGADILCDLGNFYDLTLNPEFGTLLGFTEEEIERFFPEHLAKASEATGLTHDELMEELRRHYGGFSFDSEASTYVFSPWSVLNYLAAPTRGFRNHWFASGGRPAALLRHMLAHDVPPS